MTLGTQLNESTQETQFTDFICVQLNWVGPPFFFYKINLPISLTKKTFTTIREYTESVRVFLVTTRVGLLL